MQRGKTGGYEVTIAGGEQVRAFMPAPVRFSGGEGVEQYNSARLPYPC